MKPNQIIQGDTLKVLKKMPSDLVDTIITSPPYWGLRDYGVEGQIGLEPTLDEFIEKLLKITAELKRVLKPTGVMYWNHGDCYGGNNSRSSQGGRAGFGTKREGVFKRAAAKCLAFQNYRLITKMIDEQDWILRNTIIWHKPNHMPSSVKDRFANSYEPVFMLVKKKKYWFDLDAVRVPWTDQRKADIERALNKHKGYQGKRSEFTAQGIKGQPVGNPIAGKNPGDIWNIPLSSKYSEGSGHSNRQGLNRKLDYVTIKAYKEYQQPIAKFLKENIEKRHKPILDEEFGKHKWTHWIRTDYSGAALPGVEDWWKLKEIIGFDDSFDNKIYEVQKLNIPIFQSGRNPSDVWKIATQPFSEAHFATFPEKLITPMILSSCPKEICKKCGKTRVRISRAEKEYTIGGQYGEKKVDSPHIYNKKMYGKKSKATKWRTKTETIGWTDCKCKKGFRAGIVLDPFIGSGTVAVVAKRYMRNYLGIELNPDYIKMAKQRITAQPVPML